MYHSWLWNSSKGILLKSKICGKNVQGSKYIKNKLAEYWELLQEGHTNINVTEFKLYNLQQGILLLYQLLENKSVTAVMHHRWLNGYEFEQTLGADEGQGSPVCCSPWGHKESDTTEQLHNSNARILQKG